MGGGGGNSQSSVLTWLHLEITLSSLVSKKKRHLEGSQAICLKLKFALAEKCIVDSI